MKSLKAKTQTRIFYSGILIIMMIFSLESCSTKAMFTTSSVVPAAEGYVKVKTDKNKNYVIQIEITNFAGVERLQTEKKTYVVWMLTDEQQAKNIGRVNSSRKLKVDFKTVSSYKPIQIFISAEENENAQYPGDQVVLTTEKFFSNRQTN